MVWMGVWQLSPWPCSSTPLSQDSLDSLKRVGWDYQHSQSPLSHQKHNHLPIPKIYSWWASEDTDILGSRICLPDMSYKIVYVPLMHVTLCHSRRCQLIHQELLTGLLVNYRAMAELCFFHLTSPLAYYFVLPTHLPCPFIFILSYVHILSWTFHCFLLSHLFLKLSACMWRLIKSQVIANIIKDCIYTIYTNFLRYFSLDQQGRPTGQQNKTGIHKTMPLACLKTEVVICNLNLKLHIGFFLESR